MSVTHSMSGAQSRSYKKVTSANITNNTTYTTVLQVNGAGRLINAYVSTANYNNVQGLLQITLDGNTVVTVQGSSTDPVTFMAAGGGINTGAVGQTALLDYSFSQSMKVELKQLSASATSISCTVGYEV